MIKTSAVHAASRLAQPAGWGLSVWQLHGASRNHASSWVAVHEGTYWPMPFNIQPSSRTPGAFTIKTTGKHAGSSGRQPAAWGLSSWNAHGAQWDETTSRVAVHSGSYWPMDWYIEPSTRTAGTWVIKTSAIHRATQPEGWGLGTWRKDSASQRNSVSSWVFTTARPADVMDWVLEPVECVV